MRVPLFNRTIAMLLLAILAGLFAAWSAREYLQDRARKLEDNAKVVMVERVVAAYDLRKVPAWARNIWQSGRFPRR